MKHRISTLLITAITFAFNGCVQWPLPAAEPSALVIQQYNDTATALKNNVLPAPPAGGVLVTGSDKSPSLAALGDGLALQSGTLSVTGTISGGGGGGAMDIVQTIGTGTDVVMSQAAATKMNHPNPANPGVIAIGPDIILSGASLNAPNSQIAIGKGANVQPGNGMAVGWGATVKSGATQGMAIGYGATIETNVQSSVALGYGATATEGNTVAIGNAGLKRRLVHLAAGTAGTDAVNLDQLNAALASASGTGGGAPYTLPPATASTLGGVKIGAGINVAPDGTISAKPAWSIVFGKMAYVNTGQLTWRIITNSITAKNTNGDYYVQLEEGDANPGIIFVYINLSANPVGLADYGYADIIVYTLPPGQAVMLQPNSGGTAITIL